MRAKSAPEQVTVILDPLDAWGLDPLDASIVSQLNRGRVFRVTRIGNDFRITELCDECFSVTLSMDQLKQLGTEFIEMAEAARAK